MAFVKKTPLEKFQTRVKNLLNEDERFEENSQKVSFNSKKLFEYSSRQIKYGVRRVFVTKVEPLTEEDFSVTIVLANENLGLISSNIANPPMGTRVIMDLFRKSVDSKLNAIVIGSKDNKIQNRTLSITKELYETITGINKEEGKDKSVRFINRAIPFLRENYAVDPKVKESQRDYSLLLKELIASGSINQEDIISLAQNLNVGYNADVIIKQQVNKQVEWLIDKIQDIIDEPKLSRASAKKFGNNFFGFLKTEIQGPEHLMEMILTKYGQYTLFGVPVLLNTDKYVMHTKGLSRSQFDLILINHLSDIEVVELKRPDIPVLDYDEGRDKFYASKELAVAVSQAERYISAVYRENDEDYKIGGLKIRDYINAEIGGSMTVEISRPKGLVVIGRIQSIAPDYDLLSDNKKNKVTEETYSMNSLQAYKELKGAYKHIDITTYSELLESARTRMLINKAENKEEIKQPIVEE